VVRGLVVHPNPRSFMGFSDELPPNLLSRFTDGRSCDRVKRTLPFSRSSEIERTHDTTTPAIQDVGINHRGFDIGMA
jgi:hypothetical protein